MSKTLLKLTSYGLCAAITILLPACWSWGSMMKTWDGANISQYQEAYGLPIETTIDADGNRVMKYKHGTCIWYIVVNKKDEIVRYYRETFCAVT